MMLLTALIFRAVSIEFRSKQTHATWRTVWDVCFFIGSLVAALLFGVLVGNLAWGLRWTPTTSMSAASGTSCIPTR